jgi:hypothetical protein
MSLATVDWPAIGAELDASGCAVTPRLLTPAQCRDLAGLYDRPELFRSAAPVRHGVSTVRSGHRHALGLVFHDA